MTKTNQKFYTSVFRLKNSIIHIGYDNGEKFVHEVQFEPHLGIPSKEETGYKTIDGKNVKKITFNNIYEWNKFKKDNGEAMSLYDDIDPCYQFIVEEYPKAVKYNTTDIQTMFFDLEIIDTTKDSNEFPDPETTLIPIISAAFKLSKSKKYFVFGLQDFDINDIAENKDGIWTLKKTGLEIQTSKIQYIKCDNEKDLLLKVLRLWSKTKPDVVTGWNIIQFDIPYLINRIKMVLGDDALKYLSYFTKPSVEVKWFNNRKEFKSKIPGVAIFDLLPLYKDKYPLESYALTNVAAHEIESEKVHYDEYDNIFEFHRHDYQKFIEYMIWDTELPYLLEKKLGIINTQINLAYIHKCNFEDTLGQVRAWDQIIFDFLTQQNIMVPPRNSGVKEHFVGAYVKDINPGIYKWVVSFDVNSMYPNAVMQYNISPDTIIGRVDTVDRQNVDQKYMDPNFKNAEDYILAPNGVAFRKDIEGFGPKLMRYLYTERKKCKKKLLEYKSLLQEAELSGNKADILKYEALSTEYKGQDDARKVSLNSYFGALGNEWFRYFDVRMAEAITMAGQFAIISASNAVDDHLMDKYSIKSNTYIYSDTDSNFFTLDKITPHIFDETDPTQIKIDKIDKFCEDVIQPQINKSFKHLAEKMNCNNSEFVMKRENIMECGLWKAKKHYCMYIWDSEGTRYTEPKLKAKGIQLVQSSTPGAVKPFLRASIIHLMKSPKDLRDYITEVKAKFVELDPELIATAQSVNNIRKYSDQKKIWTKGCPMNVRAAIVHNACIARGDFKSEPINESEKVKFVHMRIPNPYFNSNVVGFTKSFKYNKIYVDYEKQFDKTFLKTVEELSKAVGVNISPQLSLEDIFG